MATCNPKQCAQEVEKALEGHIKKHIDQSLLVGAEREPDWYQELANLAKPVPDGQVLPPIIAVALDVWFPSVPPNKSQKSSWMLPGMRGWFWCKIQEGDGSGPTRFGAMYLFSGIGYQRKAEDIRSILINALGEEAEVLGCCMEAIAPNELNAWIERQEDVLLRAVLGCRLRRTKAPKPWKGKVSKLTKAMLLVLRGLTAFLR